MARAGVLATEVIYWKDPEESPPPADTPRGTVLIGWIFCHKGMEFWSSLRRVGGAWVMTDGTPVPSYTRVTAWADPPSGPGEGLRQHGEAS